MQDTPTRPPSQPHPKLAHIMIDELDALTITGNGYQAVVLLQGAQLMYFATDTTLLPSDLADSALTSKSIATTLTASDNWLWVGEQAEYKRGQSVRGGVPICWPVFGRFDANPQAVKDSFANCPYDVSKHGYAKTQDFELVEFVSDSEDATLCLALPANKGLPLALQVRFRLSKAGVTIETVTHNTSEQTVHFSQALHTYLPTADIDATSIAGFDHATYSDALSTDEQGNWLNKTQQGEVTFDGEVDRVYHSSSDITLTTPQHHYILTASGSQSTVVWNPWIQTAKTLSQFAEDDYRRMLCIETANAHVDYVSLQGGGCHILGVEITRRLRFYFLNLISPTAPPSPLL